MELYSLLFKEDIMYLDLGVSMFNPTRKHDTNPTWVFSGQGWTLMGLGHKQVDLKATR